MFAMQMTICMGKSHDGSIVHDRVVACVRSHQLRRDLIHASYLVNPKEFVYAPFYVWRDEDAMRGFLLGKSFAGVVQAFGRPRIRTWNVLQFDQIHREGAASFGVREVDAICREDDLATAARREGERHRALLGAPGLEARAVVLDPDRWEIARFSLWRDEGSACNIDADCVETYLIGDFARPIAA